MMITGNQCQFGSISYQQVMEDIVLTPNTLQKQSVPLLHQSNEKTRHSGVLQELQVMLFRLTKQLLGIAIPGVGLVFSLPIILFIAIFIKLDSPLPLHQKRAGKNGNGKCTG